MTEPYLSDIRPEIKDMLRYCEFAIMKGETDDPETMDEVQRTLLGAEDATTADETAFKVIKARNVFRENFGSDFEDDSRMSKLSAEFEKVADILEEAGYDVD